MGLRDLRFMSEIFDNLGTPAYNAADGGALRALSRCTEELITCQLANSEWAYTPRSEQSVVEPTSIALAGLLRGLPPRCQDEGP